MMKYYFLHLSYDYSETAQPVYKLYNNNFLLTEREGRTGEYWPEVVSVQKRPRANIPQYDPEQVKLVSSLLYGIIFRTKQHFR